MAIIVCRETPTAAASSSWVMLFCSRVFLTWLRMVMLSKSKRKRLKAGVGDANLNKVLAIILRIEQGIELRHLYNNIGLWLAVDCYLERDRFVCRGRNHKDFTGRKFEA